MKSEKIKINKNKSTIFLDLDGTIYASQNSSFKKSLLKRKILYNALLFIQNKLRTTKNEAKKILREVQNKYGENISMGLAELYGISKQTYFNTVWNIEAKNIVKYNKKTKNLIIYLKEKYNILIVSDAPMIWIKNVLKEMRIVYLFKNNLICGEKKYKKSLNNQFDYLINKYNLQSIKCISIGNQEKTDIIPAKKLGMRTILISKIKNKYADYTVSDIKKINKIL